MKITIIIVLFFCTVFSETVNAQDQQVVVSSNKAWYKIGEMKADANMQTTTLTIVGSDEFKAIKLRALDAPVLIKSLEIQYQSGEKEQIKVEGNLEVGDETRTFDLKKSKDEINKIIITRQMTSDDKKEATVELYGMK